MINKRPHRGKTIFFIKNLWDAFQWTNLLSVLRTPFSLQVWLDSDLWQQLELAFWTQISKKRFTGAGNGVLISVLRKFSLFYLAVKINVVILMRKYVGISLLLELSVSSELDWGSSIAKTASWKLEPWFVLSIF